MPFIVDSLRIVINRMGLTSHLTIHMGGIRVKRDSHNRVTEILPRNGGAARDDVLHEAPIFIEIDRQTDPATLSELHKNFERALEDNRAVFEDWDKMRTKVREIIKELDTVPKTIDISEIEETKAFLNWMEDHHFTF